MATTALIVKRTLKTHIAALHASDVDAVEVLNGPADVEQQELERLVSIGGVQSGQADLDSLDLGTEGELYVVSMITAVDLPVGGEDGQVLATETALALWDRQVTYLREGHDGALGLGPFGVLGLRPARQWDLLERVSARGRSAAVRWGVQVIGQRQ